MPNIILFKNSIIEHNLSIIRDENTDFDNFRRGIKKITTIIACSILENLPLKNIDIKTPVANATVKCLITEKIPVIVPIVRAGIGMVDPFLDFLPNATVRHIGLRRIDEPEENGGAKISIETYMNKLPDNMEGSSIIVVDPMLATGLSACDCIDALLQRKVSEEQIKYACIIASKDGISYVINKYPGVNFYCAAIDETLTPNKFISAGLGDAGDRLCGT